MQVVDALDLHLEACVRARNSPLTTVSNEALIPIEPPQSGRDGYRPDCNNAVEVPLVLTVKTLAPHTPCNSCFSIALSRHVRTTGHWTHPAIACLCS
jgi:hypothetical protein